MKLMNNKRSQVSLRIHSSILSCDIITKALGVEPTKCLDKGAKIHRNNAKIRERSMWILESQLPEEETLDKHIDKLLIRIDKMGDRFSSLLEQVDCDLFCFFSTENGQGSIGLDKLLLQKLAKYPLDIIIDLYLSEDD